MQIPRPGGYRLWLDEPVAEGIPYVYFVERFSGGLPGPEVLGMVYRRLLGEAERALVIAAGSPEAQDPGHAMPHNVLLTRDWMVVTPRRKLGLGGANANAAAMLGMVWLSDDGVLGRWLELGPSRVLAEVGVPV